MSIHGFRRIALILCFGLGIPLVVRGQSLPPSAQLPSEAESSASPPPAEWQALTEALGDLRTQVRELSSQVSELRSESKEARDEVRSLREALNKRNEQAGPVVENAAYRADSIAARETIVTAPQEQGSAPQAESAAQSSTEERLAKIEEDQQLLDAKMATQYQSKVESGSNYRIRLSGIAVVNLYENRGTVDNQDFPVIAEPGDPLGSAGAFGGSLRQSQIGLQVFGPDIAGAQTSADVKFDFAGGFPDQPNGATMGLVRLRTGTLRMDWLYTSIVVGQDRLFFAPLAPTSLATLATPPLSYAGNLWSWTPQVRVEHRVELGNGSSLLAQGGILDSFSGDVPFSEAARYPSWGEMSGQPAYAARVAWSHRVLGQEATVGAGGYYGRQNWGLNRTVDGWAGTIDLSLPLSNRFGLTAAFYRGRAVAGLGGGLGQDVVWNGSFTSPTTAIHGLDSVGGWAQLKFKATSKLEFNAALGDDNPFAPELRRGSGEAGYLGVTLSRNFSPFVNFIYQMRSDVLFSLEYRQLRTFQLDETAVTAHEVNVSMGYLF